MRHDGFLDALRDDPEDDATRLIYADWLDDHGDAERANFIRVQVRLARVSTGDPERPALEARNQEAMQANGARWLEGRPSSLSAWRLRGGLIDRLDFDHTATMADIEPLLVQHPIRELKVGNASILRPLARSSALGLIRSLVIDASLDRRSAHDLDFLLASPFLGRLRGLSLHGEAVNNHLAHALTRSAHLRDLRVLNLKQTALSDAGVVQLLRPGVLPNLVEWDVQARNASCVSLEKLFAPHRAANWQALVWGEPLFAHHESFAGLARCVNLKRLDLTLPSRWPVRRLYIGTRSFSDTEAQPVLRWLGPLKQLTELALRGVVDGAAIDELAAWPGLARLDKLSVQVDPSRREAVRRALEASAFHNPATAIAL
jgi:uncharacterized protein (TIGR02996 family)